ncbi:MAG: hypothetical protein C5B50_22470, partial [Verrucomicrobia bacterium]
MNSDRLTIRAEALEPLFGAWEEPSKHRVRADSGEGAVERKGRRASGIAIAQNLRAMVKEWRDSFYFGASETTRHLLNHWFGRAHRVRGSAGLYEPRSGLGPRGPLTMNRPGEPLTPALSP